MCALGGNSRTSHTALPWLRGTGLQNIELNSGVTTKRKK